MTEFEMLTSMLNRLGVDHESKVASNGDVEVNVQNYTPPGYKEVGYFGFFSVWVFREGKLLAVSHWE